ncbi:AraC family transcriptional regulator [Cognatiyoonia sp. IB215182]|uniref:helix-turn-helix domain-containing protein n=1 Tax=Cognatiyoonia sp. IB215182 TaxID=3097353 RepID=UPI002A156106|nr:AraC family transcriptional regulator [Cognatiyoonia sp. IB215182]MDX8355198.1 AraC family transcriptional regulator [Cognatiyoonia sp. IB215182]
MDTIIDNSGLRQPLTRFQKMPHETDLGGVRLILLPPGRVNIRHKLAFNIFDVNLASVQHNMAWNSDTPEDVHIRGESLAVIPTGTDFSLEVENPLPGCVLEVDDPTLHDWMEAGELSVLYPEKCLRYRPDGVAAELGRSAIRHLMRAARSNVPTDRLTVEALALGIAARGMAQLGALDGDVDAEIDRWVRGTHSSAMNRAIDLIETRLCDSELSIQELASTACLSSSHFSSVFKSVIGETPYAFILRRRAEYARDLIIGTREPLAQISYDAGFSSQAHMTVVVRKVFGVTPAAMRN